MRKLVLVCFAAVLAIVVAGCGKKLSKEEMVERGRYLVNCCGVLKEHTPLKDGKPDMTRFMAGSSVGYKGPWGVYYPKNLTPDQDTGIMLATEDEKMAEIKGDGINPKPAVFSDYYKNMTEEDVRSIMMYLNTLPPISNKIPKDLKPGEKYNTAVIDLGVTAKSAAAPAKKTETKKSAPAKKTTPVKKTTTKKK